MDGTGEHHAKWNKPGGEGQISILLFNINLLTANYKSCLPLSTNQPFLIFFLKGIHTPEM